MSAVAETFSYGPVARPRRQRRKGFRLAGLTLAWGMIAAIALAAWSVIGNGDGYGKTGTLVAPTTQNIASADLTGDLFPGGQGSVSVRATNTNNAPLFISGYTIPTVDPIMLPDNPPGCGASNFSVVTQSATGLNVGPFTANGTTTASIPNVIALNANAPTQCQNVRVQVSFSALNWTT